MLNTIVIIIVGCSIFSVFWTSIVEDTDLEWADVWYMFKKVVLFVPFLLIGTILHVIGDFKNHRLGYIVLFIFLSFLAYGFYMGYKAGPSSPAPWQ